MEGVNQENTDGWVLVAEPEKLSIALGLVETFSKDPHYRGARFRTDKSREVFIVEAELRES